MIRVVVILAILLGGHAVAEAACKAKGKVLFRETTRPLPELALPEGSDTKLEVFATGAWVYVVGEAETTGCLSKTHLTELKRTLKKAKFELITGQGHCRARTTMEVVYASPKRKKKVTFAAPCGDEPDDWTRNLAACAQLARDVPDPSKARILGACRGDSDAVLFESQSEPTLTIHKSGAWTYGDDRDGVLPSWHLKLIKKARADNLRMCAEEALADHDKDWIRSVCKGKKPKQMEINGRLY